MNQLPTKADVFKHYLHSRNDLLSSSNANHSERDVCKLVATDLISVWKRASIPTVSKKSPLNWVILLVDEANKLIRYQVTNRQEKAQHHIWNYEPILIDCLILEFLLNN